MGPVAAQRFLADSRWFAFFLIIDTPAALGIDFPLTLVMLGLTYLAAIQFGWPLAAVWLAVPITWLVCLAVCYGWMKSGWRKRLTL